jgi:hypothetical protein
MNIHEEFAYSEASNVMCLGDVEVVIFMHVRKVCNHILAEKIDVA